INVYAPPPIVPGMVTVCLDLKGRLIEFRAVPPLTAEPAKGPATAPDWKRIFAQAELDFARVTPATACWNPPLHSDERVARQGVYPERPEIPIHVEAMAYRGRPVFFHVGPRD